MASSQIRKSTLTKLGLYLPSRSITLTGMLTSVMDRDGKYIPNLGKGDFRIWEDGIEQRVAYFASTEKPFTVALVIDTSGSVRERLQEIQDAAITFVDQIGRASCRERV